MLKRNTSGLQSHARQKRDSALIRTEQAIQKLLKENKSINFGVVAQEAGVSRTWLYNQIEIRERIEELRDKQLVKKTKIQKATPDNQIEPGVSKTNIIIELQQRINKLETENLVLRQHLEVVYGMSNSELVRTVEVLQVEKAELKRQLQELSKTNDTTAVSELINRQLHERISALESEKAEMSLQHKQVTQQLDKLNSDLNNQENLKLTNQKQTEDIKNLQIALESTKKKTKGRSTRFKHHPCSTQFN